MSYPNEFLFGLSGWVKPVAHVVDIGLLLVDGVSKQAHTTSLLDHLKQVVVESLPVFQPEVDFRDSLSHVSYRAISPVTLVHPPTDKSSLSDEEQVTFMVFNGNWFLPIR